MGVIVGVYFGSFLYGVLIVVLFYVWVLIVVDFGVKNNEKFFNLLKGVVIFYLVVNIYLFFVYLFNWIYDCISGFCNLNVIVEII